MDPLQKPLEANSDGSIVQDWRDFLVIIARGNNDAGGKGDVWFIGRFASVSTQDIFIEVAQGDAEGSRSRRGMGEHLREFLRSYIAATTCQMIFQLQIAFPV
jgi:hypothetical protein